jgi:xanthine/CO dehydrogenase XdhC/CoxF family maturation factor
MKELEKIVAEAGRARASEQTLALTTVANIEGWQVTVADHRPAYVTTARFPLADNVVWAAPDNVLSHVGLSSDMLALVMTHNYLRDLKLLEILLPSPVRYLDQLGPRKRTGQLLDELRQNSSHGIAEIV